MDDGLRPPTIKLAPLDQDLVPPEPGTVDSQAAERERELGRQTRAVTTIQTCWRSTLVKREERGRYLKTRASVLTIQRVARQEGDAESSEPALSSARQL